MSTAYSHSSSKIFLSGVDGKDNKLKGYEKSVVVGPFQHDTLRSGTIPTEEDRDSTLKVLLLRIVRKYLRQKLDSSSALATQPPQYYFIIEHTT